MKNWAEYTLQGIVGAKNADGSSMLEEFLKDYANKFSVELSSLQPSCNNCLTKYYNDYISTLKDMNTNCNYKLLPKFHGIPLEFGSSVFLTNANLTNEYAEKLISRYLDVYEQKEEDFNPEMLFSEFPTDWEEAHFEADLEDLDLNEEEVNETEVADEDLKLSELREKYPDIKAGSQKAFLEKLAETQNQ